MEENREKTVKTGEKQGQFTKDDPRINREGRPKGSLDFKTKWFKFIEKVAEQNQLKPDDVEEQLLAVAFKKAKEGDYSFWRDTFDRVYGKPMQKSEITGKDGKDLIPESITEEDKAKLKSLLNNGDTTSTG